MHLSRLTTAVAIAAALSVPALSAPAHATALNTDYLAITGFSPSSAVGNTGDTVTVTNRSGAVAVFKASWITQPRVVQNNASTTFTMTQPSGNVTALGTGIANSIYTIS